QGWTKAHVREYRRHAYDDEYRADHTEVGRRGQARQRADDHHLEDGVRALAPGAPQHSPDDSLGQAPFARLLFHEYPAAARTPRRWGCAAPRRAFKSRCAAAILLLHHPLKKWPPGTDRAYARLTQDLDEHVAGHAPLIEHTLWRLLAK